jgi:hypothetical protein
VRISKAGNWLARIGSGERLIPIAEAASRLAVKVEFLEAWTELFKRRQNEREELRRLLKARRDTLHRAKPNPDEATPPHLAPATSRMDRHLGPRRFENPDHLKMLDDNGPGWWSSD